MFQATAFLSILVVCALGAPQNSYRPPTYPSHPVTPPTTVPPYEPPCPDDQVRDVAGNCVTPEFSRDLFVFQEPDHEPGKGTDRPVPKPKVKVNLLVIRTAHDQAKKPIVVPPPQEKTLVLVLSKNGDDSTKVLEVPAPPGQQPEVFFINYDEGDNSLLPGGIYLQDALQYAASQNGDNGSDENGVGGYGNNFYTPPY